MKKQPALRYVKNGFMHSFNRMIVSERDQQIRQEIALDDKTWWKEDTAENWAGHIPGSLPEPLRESCRRPFHQLYVHYNGNVVLCCCDWKGEVVYGNLMEDSLVEVYSGPVATRYRENLARKNRKMKLCEVCNYRGNYHFMDRLMSFVSRLLFISH